MPAAIPTYCLPITIELTTRAGNVIRNAEGVAIPGPEWRSGMTRLLNTKAWMTAAAGIACTAIAPDALVAFGMT